MSGAARTWAISWNKFKATPKREDHDADERLAELASSVVRAALAILSAEPGSWVVSADSLRRYFALP